ncbi:MAG: hypothetical protein DRR08_21165 [Candidatus Parabeggiatoa sp. nov. 2]|nr:MAG: hypothetical protein B6247_15150 [Beggiatoa sp. 4572_84]RKZ56646.1 MAG: hypothetical protein DRR08_21165 [Gammaproteobacteria bacterium]
MDIFSHALWGGGLFGYRRYFWLAVFFGAFPDLSSFGVYLIIRVIDGTFTLGAPPLDSIPDWVFFNYNLTHSFITALVVIGITAFWKKSLAFAMLGWPFHICLDFPFHTTQYFPTQLFWPVSDFVIDGIAWNTSWVWFPNVAGILVLFLWRWRVKRNQVS